MANSFCIHFGILAFLWWCHDNPTIWTSLHEKAGALDLAWSYWWLSHICCRLRLLLAIGILLEGALKGNCLPLLVHGDRLTLRLEEVKSLTSLT